MITTIVTKETIDNFFSEEEKSDTPHQSQVLIKLYKKEVLPDA